MLVSLLLLLIDWTDLFRLLFLFLNYAVIIFMWLKFKTYLKGFCYRTSNLEALFFGVLVFIFLSLVFDLFVCITWFIVIWSWNLSLVVFTNFLWDIFKSYIHLYFPHRFVEGRGEGYGCVIELVIINWLTGFNSIIPSSSCWFLFSLVSAVKEEVDSPYIFIYKHNWGQIVLWESFIVLVWKLQLFKEGSSRFGG